MKTLKTLFTTIILAAMFTACSNDDDTPQIINEEEVITDVRLIVSDDLGSTTYTFTDPNYRTEDYVDPVINLDIHGEYNVRVEFLNNSNPSEPENITEEVIAEKDEHFVVYNFTGVDLDLTREDTAETTDSNGIEIGINTHWNAHYLSQGAVRLRLIHDAETKSTDNPEGEFTGGSTDVDVVFDVVID